MTSKEEQIQALFNHEFAGKAEVIIKRQRRIFIKVQRNDLIKLMEFLAKELGTQHLSTITARDTGTDLEVLYHFIVGGVLVNVRTLCPRNDPTVESIIEIFPSAILYEREINDILGIVAKGHPDLRRLILPDDWTEGYPLRKDWKPSGGDSADQN